MATLDDKLLGEKVHNYCSSSEDEEQDEATGDGGGGEEGDSSEQRSADDRRGKASSHRMNKIKPVREEESLQHKTHWTGTAGNTGPKGVIQDWQRFKQLEAERREQDDAEKLRLLKKLSITAQTKEEDEKAAAMSELDAEFEELMEEGFLLEYQRKRMAEMLAMMERKGRYGELIDLKTGDDFLQAIDKENKNTTVVVHIYREKYGPCTKMNDALKQLAKEYLNVKFCKFICTDAGLSNMFKASGVPALLIYKGGQMIGNFVKLVDDLSDEFDYSDVESFLVENGIINDKSCNPAIVQNQQQQ
ncbi:phosducin-like protein [Anopheles darlingi]|uniref:Phosducin-like protein n=1 Tax=Anopheles darlingi TaxID=43151 RepID=W5J8L2_ANODA|nr:phosducin-like protein [Anopheles darlingi]ETN60797.1 phosducin-like protein [Anopheles darlingi]